MAGEAWPMDASSGSPSYTGAELRHVQAALLQNGTANAFGARAGRRPGAGMVVTAASLSWSVTPGAFIAVPGFSASQGPYLVDFAGTEAGAYNAPHATLTRYDILQVRVDDAGAGDGSGARAAVITYKANPTPGSTTLPTLDARCNLLATIVVPAAGSPTIVTGPVGVASGGILPLLSTEKAGLTKHDGLCVFETDTKRIYIASAGAWVLISLGDGKMTQSGSSVVTTNTFGGFNVTYPIAFSAPPIVVANSGDHTVPGLVSIVAAQRLAASFGGEFRDAPGMAIRVSASTRVDWIATGTIA